MKATVPLMGSSSGGGAKDDTAVEMYAATYRAPAVPEKREVVHMTLPSDPSERELALKKWADDLGRWQSSLETNSHDAGASSAVAREPNWPPLLRFWRYFLPELPQHAQAGVQRLYWLFLIEIAAALFNAIALCVARATTTATSADADIVRAFVLFFVFGTVASFAVFRCIYTALRKLRRVLLAESLVWVGLQIAVVSHMRIRVGACAHARSWTCRSFFCVLACLARARPGSCGLSKCAQ